MQTELANCSKVMRKIKWLLCVLLLIGVTNVSIHAQDSSESLFSFESFLKPSYRNDLKFTKPDGFVDYPITECYPFKANRKYISETKYVSNGNQDGFGGFPYVCVLQSEAKDCVILYPMYDFGAPRFEGQIQEDVSYAAEDELMDIRPLVKIIDKKDGAYISNADKAVIYEFKTPKKHFGLYDNFVGIYLRKQGHGCLLLKIGLTEEGLKHKDEYIKMLLSSIKYGDKILNPDDKMPTDDEFCFEPPTRLRPETKEGYIQ